jgi:hypothetical protein
MNKDNAIRAAVITGVFAVVAAIIGALATHWFGLTTPSVQAMPTRSSTSSSSTITSPTATASATSTITVIYHEGRLVLANNRGADLDAPLSDPQWGEASATSEGGGADIWNSVLLFAGLNDASLVTVNSGTDTTCQKATGWLEPNLAQDLHLSVGSFVCVHTNQGRYSLLRVEAIDSTNNVIDFYVKTFKKPGD